MKKKTAVFLFLYFEKIMYLHLTMVLGLYIVYKHFWFIFYENSCKVMIFPKNWKLKYSPTVINEKYPKEN